MPEDLSLVNLPQSLLPVSSLRIVSIGVFHGEQGDRRFPAAETGPAAETRRQNAANNFICKVHITSFRCTAKGGSKRAINCESETTPEW